PRHLDTHLPTPFFVSFPSFLNVSDIGKCTNVLTGGFSPAPSGFLSEHLPRKTCPSALSSALQPYPEACTSQGWFTSSLLVLDPSALRPPWAAAVACRAQCLSPSSVSLAPQR